MRANALASANWGLADRRGTGRLPSNNDSAGGSPFNIVRRGSDGPPACLGETLYRRTPCMASLRDYTGLYHERLDFRRSPNRRVPFRPASFPEPEVSTRSSHIVPNTATACCVALTGCRGNAIMPPPTGRPLRSLIPFAIGDPSPAFPRRSVKAGGQQRCNELHRNLAP